MSNQAIRADHCAARPRPLGQVPACSWPLNRYTFYVGGKRGYERDEQKDDSILERDGPPTLVPSYYCSWRPSDDGMSLSWDETEKFNHYVEWLQFLIDNFFKPWGYVLNGKVDWRGEEFFDTGKIIVTQNAIEIFGNLSVTEENGSARNLKVFLCHAKDDKLSVRDIYGKLKNDRIKPWLDEEDLIPGQNWEHEIKKAVETTDLFVVCLSKRAVDKVGFVQKEIKFALDVADLQPEGRIFIIPLKLEECDVPDRLKSRHWINYFEADGYFKLQRVMEKRIEELNE